MTDQPFERLLDFFEGLHFHGISLAVVSPGSRNAPLIKALHQCNFTLTSVVDERSAGFIALGMAKTQKSPVILCCTSGTAVLNYYPAIAEAFYSRIPLLIITADRPPEQIDQWEGQAVRQVKVFSNHVRWESGLDIYDLNLSGTERADMISEVIETTIPGPIHINIPLREPLYNFVNGPVIRVKQPSSVAKSRIFQFSLEQIANYLEQDWTHKNVLFFTGADMDESLQISNGDIPILSDVTSCISGNVIGWDAYLFTAIKHKEDLAFLQPDILVSVGGTTVSKGLRLFLKAHPPQAHFHISRHAEVGDMFTTNPVVIHPDGLIKVVGNSSRTDFLSKWQTAVDAFTTRMKKLSWSTFTEFGVMKYLFENLPKPYIIHVSNSMPVRYASFLGIRYVHANRGTSGIDGCTSTAVGFAMLDKQPQVLITGDLAFLYDINALWVNDFPSNLKVVVVNNGGGGIFELIEGPQNMGDAWPYQTTNHQRNIESLVAHFGMEYFCANDNLSLANKMREWLNTPGSAILEVNTDRRENQAFFKNFKSLIDDRT